MEETKIKEILKKRAQSLASTSDKNIINKDRIIDGLFFNLSDDKYALDSRYISEVVSIKEITTLPCTPDFLLGIINIRGNIVSLIDIKSLFGVPNKGITNFNTAIVVKHEDIEFGILADEIEGNKVIDVSSLQENITTITKIPDNFIIGVATDNTIVLDIRELLMSSRIVIDHRV